MLDAFTWKRLRQSAQALKTLLASCCTNGSRRGYPTRQGDLDTFKAELALRRFTVAFTKIEFEA